MMVAVKDETGKRYGRLTVLSRTKDHRKGLARWLCRCDCGKETSVDGHELRRGGVKSCGCLRYAYRLSNGGAAFSLMLRQIRRSAKVRGYTWELTREQVRVLSKQPCYYCGIEPRQIVRYSSSEYVCNGIDRMNNDLGYTETNCVPCCKGCNYIKGTRTAEDFIALAIKIADRHRR